MGLPHRGSLLLIKTLTYTLPCNLEMRNEAHIPIQGERQAVSLVWSDGELIPVKFRVAVSYFKLRLNLDSGIKSQN
jgi:hypothetical protein